MAISIRNPADVVKTGDRLKVRVLSVDKARRRIALSAKTQTPVGGRPERNAVAAGNRRDDNHAGFHAPRRDSRTGQPSKSGFSINPFAGL